MPEYINRDRLYTHIRLASNRNALGETAIPFVSGEEVIMLIADAPVADVVEVVRCKNCKFLYFKDMTAYCPHKVGECSPMHFCGYGKRK